MPYAIYELRLMSRGKWVTIYEGEDGVVARKVFDAISKAQGFEAELYCWFVPWWHRDHSDSDPIAALTASSLNGSPANKRRIDMSVTLGILGLDNVTITTPAIDGDTPQACMHKARRRYATQGGSRVTLVPKRDGEGWTIKKEKNDRSG
jgi:hypothetical protein